MLDVGQTEFEAFWRPVSTTSTTAIQNAESKDFVVAKWREWDTCYTLVRHMKWWDEVTTTTGTFQWVSRTRTAIRDEDAISSAWKKFWVGLGAIIGVGAVAAVADTVAAALSGPASPAVLATALAGTAAVTLIAATVYVYSSWVDESKYGKWGAWSETLGPTTTMTSTATVGWYEQYYELLAKPCGEDADDFGFGGTCWNSETGIQDRSEYEKEQRKMSKGADGRTTSKPQRYRKGEIGSRPRPGERGDWGQPEWDSDW